MNKEALFLFLIMLFGLALCSFLGGSNCSTEGYTNSNASSNSSSNSSSKTSSKYKYANNHANSYDNYNHYSGTSTLANGTTFYGPDGATATYVVSSNGIASIKVTQTSGSNLVIFNSTPQGGQSNNASSQSDNTFYGPSGFTATINYGNNGINTIVFKMPNGTTQVFTQNSNSSANSESNSINNTEYYGSVGTNMPPSNTYSAYQSGNSMYYGQNQGQNNPYYSGGIPRSQIPPGQEDLYILKSEIVPPVCPACPSSSACPSKNKAEKCPPCPACARCPEPSFECKKVPNYNAISEEYLPQPILNDFSTFGT